VSKNIKVTVNNPVAKHMETFNKPKTFVDQKKEDRKGKVKHKGRGWDSTSF
jgi:hypothetical protein